MLIENVVFTINCFANYGSGVIIARPGLAAGELALTYCILVVFVFFAVVLANLRRSTAGLGAGVTRSSARAARSLGMNPITTRMLLSGLGATAAGISAARCSPLIKDFPGGSPHINRRQAENLWISR